MNKKIKLIFLTIFLLALFNSAQAAIVIPEGCTFPSTQSCTTTEGCDGTQVCSKAGTWGTCIDVPDDDCPAVANPYVTLSWRHPTSTPWRVPWATFVGINVQCYDGPCTGVTATAQYCKGISCSSYQNILRYPEGYGQDILLNSWLGYDNPAYTSSILSGGLWRPLWYYLVYDSDIPEGETYRLRVRVTGTNFSTKTITWDKLLVNFKPEAVLTAPSNGTTIEQGQVLPISWTTSDGDNDNVYSYVYRSLYSGGECDFGVSVTQIYSSGIREPVGNHTYNWTVPESLLGQYCIFASADDSIESSAYSNTARITITEPPPEVPETFLNASILTPIDGNSFFVGSTINFTSSISSSEAYSVQWDSNKDLGWNPADENFSYSGLSIGDHNIFFTVTTDSNTARDSIVIRIKPITTDVFSISDFEVIPVEPTDRYALNGKIKVRARVNYFISEAVNAKAFIIISDAITHQAVYGPDPFYLSFTQPDYEEYDLNIDLSSYDFYERKNYKVEFLIVSNEVESSPEYFVNPTNPDSAYWDDGEPYFIPEEQIPEQNKANNSGYEIIELGPITIPSIEAPEIHPTIILLILFTVILIARKK